MELLTVFLLAVGLSFDSFAVSVCSGLNLPKIRFFQAAKIALFLAFFQASMPLIGWLLGNSIKSLIEPVDHWIAFGLLLLIGGKMIIESLAGSEEREIKNPLHLRAHQLRDGLEGHPLRITGPGFAGRPHQPWPSDRGESRPYGYRLLGRLPLQRLYSFRQGGAVT